MRAGGQPPDGGARTVVVTGSGGFVGANLVRTLLWRGHRVIGCVRPGADHWRLADLATEFERVEIDVRDAEAVDALIARTAPSWVFHLAANGAYSWQTDPGAIFATNVGSAVAIGEACVRRDVEALVLAGSSSEYGYRSHAPAETELPEPNSHYAASKAAATLYGGFLMRETPLRTTTLRLYSVYGPWEEPNRLVPKLVVHGLRGELPPLTSPTTARDFIYVDDAVAAFELAATRGTKAVYNVGSAKQTTIAELVAIAKAQLEISAEPDFGSMPARAWDTDAWVADPSQTAGDLGWSATTSIEDGLAQTAEWLRGRPELLVRYEGS